LYTSTNHSSLFPYTTLFRSVMAQLLFEDGAGDALAGDDHDRVVAGDGAEHLRQPRLVDRLRERVRVTGRRLDDEQVPGRVERHRDRKSTRLNSSHQIISYAV